MKTVKSHQFLLMSCTAAAIFALSSTDAFSFHAPSPLNIEKSSIIHVAQTSESDAKDFITSLTKEGIDFLSNKELSDEEREKTFRKFLTKSFDMKTIGRFVLGRHWKQATEAQQEEYLALFEDLIVEIYSRRFGEYDGQSIEVRSTRLEGKKDVTVSSFILSGASAPEIQIDWRVRTDNNGKLKVIDVIVENVSMSLTQRSDFSSVIQRGGGKVDVLIEHLREATQ